MKSQTLIIILLLGLCAAMFFLGRRSGTTELKQTILNNQQMVQQIAELAALEVSGNTTVKLTNAGDNNSFWDKFKNYLAENTLQVSVPYHAKYGVDISRKKIAVANADTAIVITLPTVKLLSFQLELDKLETMNQTGLFNRTTVSDMKLAQQQLYITPNKDLSTNAILLEKAKQHIIRIFTDYYKPLGYKTVCNFQP